jgi:hypothetical protein
MFSRLFQGRIQGNSGVKYDGTLGKDTDVFCIKYRASLKYIHSKIGWNRGNIHRRCSEWLSAISQVKCLLHNFHVPGIHLHVECSVSNRYLAEYLTVSPLRLNSFRRPVLNCLRGCSIPYPAESSSPRSSPRCPSSLGSGGSPWTATSFG